MKSPVLSMKNALATTIILGTFFNSVVALGAVDLTLFEKGRVHQSRDVGGRFDFPLGEMIFQPEADEQFSKGYRPKENTQLEGDLSREVYDLPHHMRVRGGFAKVRELLKTSGFEVLFECAREACGKPQPWAMYTSPMMGGSDQDQYYLAAKAGDASYAYVYAKEIGGQARILIDHILTDSSGPAGAGKELGNILFPRGSSVLSATQRRQLARHASHILAAAGEKKFTVAGHADQTGGLLRNLRLSGARAMTVRAELINEHNVSPEKLLLAAYGSAKHRGSSGGGKDRRVELIEVAEPAQLLGQVSKGEPTLD